MITCDLTHYDDPENQNNGLGNQLFKIASTIGIAKKMGYAYGFDRQYPFFKNPLPDLIKENRKSINIPWGYHDIKIANKVIIDIYSYLQSEKYFKHCEDLIRYYFTFKKLSNIKIPEGSIAVHFRAGDYGTAHHPRMTKDYYEKAFRYMPAEKVYIFTDDKKAAKEIFENNYEYVETNHYTTDLYLMTLCTHFIISNSTFPWWGAWLSNKNGIVVAPKQWFGPEKTISPKDIYCDGWFVL